MLPNTTPSPPKPLSLSLSRTHCDKVRPSQLDDFPPHASFVPCANPCHTRLTASSSSSVNNKFPIKLDISISVLWAVATLCRSSWSWSTGAEEEWARFFLNKLKCTRNMAVWRHYPKPRNNSTYSTHFNPFDQESSCNLDFFAIFWCRCFLNFRPCITTKQIKFTFIRFKTTYQL